MINKSPIEKGIAGMRITAGFVITGPLEKISNFAIEIESRLPDGCLMVYKRVNPGKLFIHAEGEQ